MRTRGVSGEEALRAHPTDRRRNPSAQDPTCRPHRRGASARGLWQLEQLRAPPRAPATPPPRRRPRPPRSSPRWQREHARLDRTRQRRRQPLRHRLRADAASASCRRASCWSATSTPRKAPTERQGTGTTIVQMSPTGQEDAVRADRRHEAAGAVSRRRRPDDRAERAARRLRRRRQPAHHQRQVGDRQVRLPDRARTAKARRSRRSPSKNIQGPWDSTAVSEGAKTTLFVSNALNGGAVVGEKHDRQLDGGADRTGIGPNTSRRRCSSETGDREGHPLDRLGGSARARADGARRSPPTARCTWPTERQQDPRRSPKR